MVRKRHFSSHEIKRYQRVGLIRDGKEKKNNFLLAPFHFLKTPEVKEDLASPELRCVCVCVCKIRCLKLPSYCYLTKRVGDDGGRLKKVFFQNP